MFFSTGNAKSTEHGTPMGFKTVFSLPPVALRATGGYQQTTPYSLGGGMMGASSTGVERPRRGSSYAAPGAAGGVKPLDRPS